MRVQADAGVRSAECTVRTPHTARNALLLRENTGSSPKRRRSARSSSIPLLSREAPADAGAKNAEHTVETLHIVRSAWHLRASMGLALRKNLNKDSKRWANLPTRSSGKYLLQAIYRQRCNKNTRRECA